jgi:glycosyltransferase involved in cell wall biosynthesis
MHKSSISCSLVTPTYNWPEALELLLLSAINQSVPPNEIIIADDGSTSETKELIETYKEKSPIPIIHIWHEDNKNQKPKIMNKAIAASKYDYIVEIDGDIIMHKDFIKDHLSSAEDNTYLYGSRVNIQKDHLETLFEEKKIVFNFFSKGIKKRGRTIRLPIFSNIYKPENVRSPKLRGCNMSFWKKDFIAVNGFNEELVGWGIDDSEMIQRLHNIGIQGKRLKFKGIVYHIYHKEQSRDLVHLNQAVEDEITKKQIKYINKGVDQYL